MVRVLSKIVFLLFVSSVVLFGCNTAGNEKKSSGISKIKEQKQIKIAIDASDYPPFAIKTPGGFVGFDIDMCYDIAKKMGVNLKIEQIKFDEILPALERGEIDLGIATFTITPKRNMDVLFSQPYIVTGQAVLVAKKHEGKVFSYRDLNSTQYKIAYVKGNSSENSIKKFMADSRFFGVDSADVLTDTLINGEADAVIADMPFCSTMMAKDGGKNFYFIDQPITFEPIGVAVNKNDYHLLNWINNYIQQIQSDGTYDEFYSKWFQNTDWIKYLKN
jgi:polar amino acid transport system substrate-binding protein